jgi:hypothetical protein
VTAFGYSIIAAIVVVTLVLLASTNVETTQAQLQKACAATCKAGVEAFEYHGANDFKCVCVVPLGATVE